MSVPDQKLVAYVVEALSAECETSPYLPSISLKELHRLAVAAIASIHENETCSECGAELKAPAMCPECAREPPGPGHILE